MKLIRAWLPKKSKAKVANLAALPSAVHARACNYHIHEEEFGAAPVKIKSK